MPQGRRRDSAEARAGHCKIRRVFGVLLTHARDTRKTPRSRCREVPGQPAPPPAQAAGNPRPGHPQARPASANPRPRCPPSQTAGHATQPGHPRRRNRPWRNAPPPRPRDAHHRPPATGPALPATEILQPLPHEASHRSSAATPRPSPRTQSPAPADSNRPWRGQAAQHPRQQNKPVDSCPIDLIAPGLQPADKKFCRREGDGRPSATHRPAAAPPRNGPPSSPRLREWIQPPPTTPPPPQESSRPPSRRPTHSPRPAPARARRDGLMTVKPQQESGPRGVPWANAAPVHGDPAAEDTAPGNRHP